MEEKVKAYCEKEYEMALKWGYNPHEALTRAYGAIMFVINYDKYNEDLVKWWEDVMLPKFHSKELHEAEKRRFSYRIK